MNFNQKWGAKTLAKINYFRVLKFKEMKEFIPAAVLVSSLSAQQRVSVTYTVTAFLYILYLT